MLKFNNKVPTDIKIGNKTVEKILMRNDVVWSRPDYFYIENVDSNSGNVSFKFTGTPSSSTIQQIEYSKNKTNWTPVTLVADTTTNVPVGVGEKVYFRNGNGKCSQSSSVYLTFGSDINTNTGGELYTLLDYTDKNVSLQNYAFYGLFYQMNKLIDASDLVLRWTTLKPNCYQSAFQGCTELTSAPQLPATTLANYCYQALFRDCSSLTTVPSVIPATTAPYMCCQRMFSDCVSLKSAPQLPASTVESGSYQYMFYNCKELTQPPTELPATTLTLNSYYSMFELCSKLTTPPVIKATTFAENSCTAMFRSCTSLNNITVCANDISATNCTQQWLRNVAATGTFYNLGSATYTIDSENGIPVGWTERKPEMNYFYVKNESSSQSNVDIIVRGTPQSDKTATSVQYSYDKYIWNTINFSPNTVYNIPLNVSQKVYLRNGNGFWSAANVAFIKILSNKDYSVGGKLSTLIDCYNEGHLVYEYCFNRLFSLDSTTDSSIYGKEHNDTLVDASMLQLIDVNRLPIKTLSKVQGRTIPEDLYLEMFEHCVNLLHSPEEVYGENVDEQGCYKMFYWCQKLLDAPKLSPTNVSFQGYQKMFMGCQSLLKVPELLMTKVYNSACEEMFSRCKKMTGNPTLLPETIGNNTYESMFEQCTSLTEVTLYLRYYSGNSHDTYQGVYHFLQDANPNGGTIHNLGGFSSGYWAPYGWVKSNT